MKIRVFALLFGNIVVGCTAPVTPNDGDSATHDTADDAALDGCLMRGTDCGTCPSCADAPNARSGCDNGVCQLRCNPGFFDCDRRYETGCEVAESVDQCGGCDARCVAPENGVATCAMSRCGFTCNAGYIAVDGACVRFETRPLHPWSGWLTASQTVEFKWVLPPLATTSRLDVCRDRACNEIELTQDFAAPTAAFMSPRLRAGNHFWRVTVNGPNGLLHQSNVWQVWIPVSQRTSFTGVDRPILDLNGDGWQDMVSCDTQCVWVANPFGGISPGRVTTIEGFRPTAAANGLVARTPGDLDGDGYSDVRVDSQERAMPFNLQLGLIFGAAAQPTMISMSVPARETLPIPRQGAVGDLEGDGYADLIGTTNMQKIGRRRGDATRGQLTTIEPVDSTNDVEFRIVQLFQAPSGAHGIQLFTYSANNYLLGALWELDFSMNPTRASQLWDDANMPILLSPPTVNQRIFVPLGDLTGDGVPEMLFARPYNVPAPSAIVLAQGERSALGAVTFRTLSDSVVPVTDDLRIVGVVSPIDLNADGQPEFVVASESNLTQGYDLFVITGDFRQPNTLRALALNGGHRDCRLARVGCGTDRPTQRARLPVGGDFDKDGYDDVIVADLDDSRLLILRGGPRIEDLRWEPLMINIPREAMGLLVS